MAATQPPASKTLLKTALATLIALASSACFGPIQTGSNVTETNQQSKEALQLRLVKSAKVRERILQIRDGLRPVEGLMGLLQIAIDAQALAVVPKSTA